MLPLQCEECQDVLDMYIADEMEGRDVRREYPLVYQHLRSCPDCSALYVAVKSGLVDNPSSSPQPVANEPRARAPFLRLPADLPWLVRPVSQLGGHLEGVVFVLSQAHVRAILKPAPATMRHEQAVSPWPQPRLLLLDTVRIGQETLTVEVTAGVTPSRPDVLTLRGLITRPTEAGPGLHATLTWLGQTRDADVADDGRVDFGEVVVRDDDLASDQAALQLALTQNG